MHEYSSLEWDGQVQLNASYVEQTKTPEFLWKTSLEGDQAWFRNLFLSPT
jgi:hypothetical protein